MPDYTKIEVDAASFTSWRSSVDRTLRAQSRDIEMLKKGFLIICALVLFLGVIMLITIG